MLFQGITFFVFPLDILTYKVNGFCSILSYLKKKVKGFVNIRYCKFQIVSASIYKTKWWFKKNYFNQLIRPNNPGSFNNNTVESKSNEKLFHLSVNL